ncbi:hypothetical protein [Gordonia sp. NPDC003376]
MTTVDSTYHRCCRSVGRHSTDCTETTTSTAEVTGRLLEQITEFAGPHSSVSTYIAADRASVDVHGVNPDRYPEWNADEPLAAVRILTAKSGRRMISAEAVTLLRALQLVASVMAFPPEVTPLRLVGGDRDA